MRTMYRDGPRASRASNAIHLSFHATRSAPIDGKKSEKHARSRTKNREDGSGCGLVLPEAGPRGDAEFGVTPGAKQATERIKKGRKEGRKEGRKAVLTGLGKGKPSSEKAPFPSVTPPLSRPVHENQPVCPASGSASNSNNWPSVFLPNATFALLMMRQGTLMILYRSRSSGKWFTS